MVFDPDKSKDLAEVIAERDEAKVRYDMAAIDVAHYVAEAAAVTAERDLLKIQLNMLKNELKHLSNRAASALRFIGKLGHCIWSEYSIQTDRCEECGEPLDDESILTESSMCADCRDEGEEGDE